MLPIDPPWKHQEAKCEGNRHVHILKSSCSEIFLKKPVFITFINEKFNNKMLISPLFPKPWTVFKVLALKVQSPASRVKHLESSVQHLRPESMNSGMPIKELH